jgi:protein arginine kinase activator
MKCHHCESQATVHLTQIINGQMHKMDLCESCAQEKGVTNPDNLSIGNLLDHSVIEAEKSVQGMVCESCGTSHQDFKKGGRLGCQACYHIFRPVLEPLLDGMHAGIEHLGKVPNRVEVEPAKVEEGPSIEEQCKQIKEELHLAVEAENYEKAAELRDLLKKLEAESASLT